MAELNPSFYGISNSQHELTGILDNWKTTASLQEIIEELERLYCSHIGVEFMHLESLEEREWIATEYENLAREEIESATKKENAKAMITSQNFDHFVAAKFPTLKRYGGEGAEGCIPFYRELFRLASADDVQHIFMSMAHRGKFSSELRFL